MAKAKSDTSSKLGLNPISQYLRETRAELAKVTWPTRDEWLRLSGIVLVVSLLMAFILGLTDALASQLMNFLLYR